MQQQSNSLSLAADLLCQSGGATSVSFADLFHPDSSTGLSMLHMQEGLNNYNTSIHNFLSLMVTSNIPHQDASLLNVPCMDEQQGQAGHNHRVASSVAWHWQMLSCPTP